MRSLCPVVLLFPTAVAAAQMPGPAPELSAFRPLVGHWIGEGRMQPAGPEGPAFEWAATLDVTPVLAGHFFQEDLAVDLGDAGEYRARTWYGWDTERARYVACSVDNEGGAGVTRVHFTREGALITARASEMANGDVSVQRSVLRITADAWEHTVLQSVDGAPESLLVQGTFHRVEGPPERAEIDLDEHAGPEGLDEDMRPLAPLVGRWRVEGEMVPMPGMDPVAIAGTETTLPAFGGRALLSRVVGQPQDYEAVTLVWADRVRGGFHSVLADSTGAFVESELHVLEGHMVQVHAGTFLGQPYAERTVLSLGDSGPTSVTSDRYTGDGPGVRVFHATYSRIE